MSASFEPNLDGERLPDERRRADRPEDSRPTVLVECGDHPGIHAAHGDARALALEEAGCSVQIHAVEDVSEVSAERGLREVLAREEPELVVFASAARAGGPLARLARAATSCWWPTVVPRGTGWSPWEGPARGALALPGGDRAEEPAYAGPLGIHPGGTEALDWALHDPGTRARPRLPLWDARYLLAPCALEGPAGRDLLRTFAALDARWNQLDLVVLDEAEPHWSRLKRTLGIAGRVHFAGPATRDAEATWMLGASGLLLATRGPVRAGLVIEAMAAGVPLLGLGPGAPRAIMGWLADRGAVPASWAGGLASTRSKLEHLLEGDTALERALARGHDVAHLHEITAVAARLADSLGLEARRRAA